MNRDGITGQFVVHIVSNLPRIFTAWREKFCFFAWTTTDNWFKVCWPVKNKIKWPHDFISRYLKYLLTIFFLCARSKLLSTARLIESWIRWHIHGREHFLQSHQWTLLECTCVIGNVAKRERERVKAEKMSICQVLETHDTEDSLYPTSIWDQLKRLRQKRSRVSMETTW